MKMETRTLIDISSREKINKLLILKLKWEVLIWTWFGPRSLWFYYILPTCMMRFETLLSKFWKKLNKAVFGNWTKNIQEGIVLAKSYLNDFIFLSIDEEKMIILKSLLIKHFKKKYLLGNIISMEIRSNGRNQIRIDTSWLFWHFQCQIIGSR